MSHSSNNSGSDIILSGSGWGSLEDEVVDTEPNHEVVPGILASIKGWNPPTLEPADDAVSPPRIDPLDLFFDRHLRSELQLKYICTTNTMLKDLCSLWPTALEVVDGRLPGRVIGDGLREPSSHISTFRMDSALDLCQLYQSKMGSYAEAVASTLLHPEHGWHSFMHWERAGGPSDYEFRKTVQDAYGVQLGPPKAIAPSLLGLNTAEKEAFRQFSREMNNVMAVWICLPVHPASDRMLQDMAPQSSTRKKFIYEACPSLSSTSTSTGIASSPDTTSEKLPPWWSSFEAELGSKTQLQLRRSQRLVPAEKSPLSPSRWVNLHAPRHEKYTSLFRANNSPDAVLQRGWAKAVETDSTFIVFTCGNYERIGIRHRGSQTLYLTDLIDSAACQNPAYGEIHVNLFLAIYQDVLSRMEISARSQKKTREATLPTRRSRRIKNIVPRGKRGQGAPSLSDLVTQMKELDTLILSFDCDTKNSVSPSIFMRQTETTIERFSPRTLDSKQHTYSPEQYISAILVERIGEGAIGIAYKANLQWMHSKSQRGTIAVVKLAFYDHQKKRLLHEYSVYQRLASHSVKGVPTIIGVFQDAAIGGPLALVMSFEGSSLIAAGFLSTGKVDLPLREQDLFFELLRNLHNAGITHGDIRAENLLVDAEGGVHIIDFDQATIEPSERAMRIDLEQLNELFSRSPLSSSSSSSAATLRPQKFSVDTTDHEEGEEQ